jgi:VanZ family protein
LVAIAILATVPLARSVQGWVGEHLGEGVFVTAVLGLIAAAALGCARALRAARTRAPRTQQLWLAATFLVLGAAALSMRGNPVEAVHLAEYALLGFLLLRAHSHHTRDRSLYLVAALWGAGLGVVDEAVQWLTPARVWDLRDIGINAFAAGATQWAVAFGIRPGWVRPSFEPAGLRRACHAALAVLALGAISCFTTPPRLGWLSARVPALAGLANHPDVMLEFGHRIDDPAIGSFRSRLSAEELRATDARRGSGAGAVLRQLADDARYPEFLARFPPARDPFLHEARVHLFRRDRYHATAAQRTDEPKRARRDLTVAYREEQILRRYFGRSLEHSGLGFSDATLAELAEAQLPRRPYTSPVSAHLVTNVSEGQLATGFLFLAGLVVFASWRLGARARCRPA